MTDYNWNLFTCTKSFRQIFLSAPQAQQKYIQWKIHLVHFEMLSGRSAVPEKIYTFQNKEILLQHSPNSISFDAPWYHTTLTLYKEIITVTANLVITQDSHSWLEFLDHEGMPVTTNSIQNVPQSLTVANKNDLFFLDHGEIWQYKNVNEEDPVADIIDAPGLFITSRDVQTAISDTHLVVYDVKTQTFFWYLHAPLLSPKTITQGSFPQPSLKFLNYLEITLTPTLIFALHTDRLHMDVFSFQGERLMQATFETDVQCFSFLLETNELYFLILPEKIAKCSLTEFKKHYLKQPSRPGLVTQLTPRSVSFHHDRRRKKNCLE